MFSLLFIIIIVVVVVDKYRKPITTVTIINFVSNHPIEYKMAAFRFHISRMYTLPLDPEKRQKE
jgi:hypothetical protein